MKVSRLEKTYVAVLMVIFGGIVLHAPLSVGLGKLFPRYSLLIKSWKEVLMLLLVPVAIYIVTRHKLWRELLSDWLLRLMTAFALLHLVLIVFLYQGAAATAAGLAIDLRYILFFVLMYIALKAFPQYRRRMVQIAIGGACVVVGFATAQLFLSADILSHIGYGRDTIAPYLTVDKNPNFIRVNSTLRGPNPLGAYAGMVLGLLAAYLRAKVQLKNKKVFVGMSILTVCAVVSLWISYSRSALAAGIVTVLVVVITSFARRVSRKTWLIGAVVVCALLGGLVAVRGSSLVSNILLHENPNGGSSISSNDDHVKSLESGISGLIQRPFGFGVGSAGSASLYGNNAVVVENQYLFVGHEIGWLGLALFSVMYVVILIRLWRGRQNWLSLGTFASGIGLGLIGLLLPVWADDTVSIIWWGLAAIALTGGQHDREQTK